jgi:hypothetical protein
VHLSGALRARHAPGHHAGFEQVHAFDVDLVARDRRTMRVASMVRRLPASSDLDAITMINYDSDDQLPTNVDDCE